MTDPTKHSQTAEILNHLIKGGKLTQLDALRKFECFRLASRIYDIRKMGFNPICEKVPTLSGKLVGEYRIDIKPVATYDMAADCNPGDLCRSFQTGWVYKVLRTPKKEEIARPWKWLQRIKTW